MNMPYTYRISWSTENISYYGVRFAKGCHPDELFHSYFTSSKYVKQYIKEHGLPDIIEIRKVFDNIDSARKYESSVLRRLKVTTNKYWLNKTDNMAISLEASYPTWSEASRLKARMSRLGKPSPNKGKIASAKTRENLSKARSGKKHSIETRLKMSENQLNRGGYGPRTQTAETRAKMSASHKARYLQEIQT